MTTELLERTAAATAPADRPTADPLAAAIAEIEGWPEAEPDDLVKTRELVIVSWSGELDRVWPMLILSSTAAASGLRSRVFVTFWGLLPFVRDGVRIPGDSWMQRMLAVIQRPGIDHLKLTKMNFLGMGPWMMRTLAKRHHVASPRELLEAAQSLGVEFVPCQMTMDMLGIRREDLIDGMAEPAGAATAIEIMTEADASLFI